MDIFNKVRKVLTKSRIKKEAPPESKGYIVENGLIMLSYPDEPSIGRSDIVRATYGQRDCYVYDDLFIAVQTSKSEYIFWEDVPGYSDVGRLISDWFPEFQSIEPFTPLTNIKMDFYTRK